MELEKLFDELKSDYAELRRTVETKAQEAAKGAVDPLIEASSAVGLMGAVSSVNQWLNLARRLERRSRQPLLHTFPELALMAAVVAPCASAARSWHDQPSGRSSTSTCCACSGMRNSAASEACVASSEHSARTTALNMLMTCR